MNTTDQIDLQQNDEFETTLSRTLRGRSHTGPRAGFDHRLAESLRQANVSADSPRGWWNWLAASLSAATLAGVVAGSFVALHHRHMPGPQQVSARVQRAPGQPVKMAGATLPAPGQVKLAHPTYRVSSSAHRRAEPVPVLAETLPRLDTFPSPAPKSDRPFGSGDPVATISPEAVRAMLGLQQQQARPITLTAINVNKPLFGEGQ